MGRHSRQAVGQLTGLVRNEIRIMLAALARRLPISSRGNPRNNQRHFRCVAKVHRDDTWELRPPRGGTIDPDWADRRRLLTGRNE
jgi:hypothetical protein